MPRQIGFSSMYGDQVHHRTGCIVGERIVVLDQARSRYFMLRTDPMLASSIPPAPDGRSTLLSWPDDRPPRLDNARATWVKLPGQVREETFQAASVGWVARLWLAERASRRDLRSGIAAGLSRLASAPRGDHRPDAVRALLDASRRSRRLWSAEDQCLPRSIALATLLRRNGSAATLMIGVTVHPFTAHAWVQEGDVVLNDTLDHATLFTPILAA